MAQSNVKRYNIPNLIEEDRLIGLLLSKCGLYPSSMAVHRMERDRKSSFRRGKVQLKTKEKK
jgi:hypothetical protein